GPHDVSEARPKPRTPPQIRDTPKTDRATTTAEIRPRPVTPTPGPDPYQRQHTPRPEGAAIVPASCWTPGSARATSARSSTSPAAHWRPASWPLQQPLRSPPTGGTYPGRA